MIIPKVALIGTSGNRTKAYLQLMKKNNLLPSYCVIMHRDVSVLRNEAELYKQQNEEPADYYDPNEPVVVTLEECGIPYRIVETEQVNDELVHGHVLDRDEEIWIYSGFGGQILKRPLINCGKKFLHIHPGIVPEFKGSTTIYYSLLQEGTCGASAIFLDENIDTGPLIAKKRFRIPDQPPDMDYIFDPFIRASLLVDVLRHYSVHQTFDLTSQTPDEGETYFIIHPVLKHIAILSEVESKEGSL
ncbi:formyltransferase family protein [Cohnella yongneupensis]|uniref:Formyltransferase family protein n=1 Tax=Cohnella yongneupensis TaxID=425006 RepID=A0ABW0QZA9_9BACL